MLRCAMVLTGVLALFLALPVRSDDPSSDKAKIEKLVRQLGDADFETREKANEELLKLGEPARTALDAAMRSDDLEVRSRAKAILDDLDKRAAKLKLDQKLATLRKPIAPPGFDASKVKDLVEKKNVIKANETWKAEKSYRVVGDLKIAAGVTLTIEPGTIVLLDDNAVIEVAAGGMLVATSPRADQPIIFTALAERDQKDGHWGRLTAQGRLRFQNVEIRRSSGIFVRDASSQLHDVGVYDTRGDGVRFENISGSHPGLTVRKATGYGIVVLQGYPTLERLRVSGVTTGMLVQRSAYPALRDVMISDVKENGLEFADTAYSQQISDVTVVGGDVGILVRSNSYPQLRKVHIADSKKHGLLIQQGSYPLVDETIIQDVQGSGLAVKGNSYPNVAKVETVNCKSDREIEPGSSTQPLLQRRDDPRGLRE